LWRGAARVHSRKRTAAKNPARSAGCAAVGLKPPLKGSAKPIPEVFRHINRVFSHKNYFFAINDTFLATNQPVAISPTSGTANTKVIITGSSFNTTPADNTVKFNGVKAAVTSASTTQLVVTAPATGTSGNIVIKTAGGTSNGVNFTYTTSADVYVAGLYEGVERKGMEKWRGYYHR
jgi:hypothetical protein